MLNLRGIKARPHDVEAMLAHRPSLVELHCSTDDLAWAPTRAYDVPLALHVPEFANGELLDPASLDERTRLRAQAIYSQAGRACLRLGSFFSGRPRVVFHPGGQTCDETGRSANRDDLMAALGKTVEAMKAEVGDGVDVLVENLPSVCWFNGGSWRSQFMTSGSDLAAFCGAHRIGATLDLCHLHLTPHAVVDQINKVLPFVRHVHYSDGRFREAGKTEPVYKEGLQIGDGDMPLEAYFAALSPIARVTRPDAPVVYAVPEIWYGHENGGGAFVDAWARTAARLVAPAGG